jgi:hypothetical protein
VLKGKIKMSESDSYSPENNLVVVKILEAAKQSAEIGKTVLFTK